MNKKKVDSILKGITAAGIAMGGVSSIQGADMVMAAIDESAADSNSLVDAGSLSESERTDYSESTTQNMSESDSASTSESISESTSTSEIVSTSESDSVSTSESISESTSTSEIVSISESISESTETSESAENSASVEASASAEASVSAETSESAKQSGKVHEEQQSYDNAVAAAYTDDEEQDMAAYARMGGMPQLASTETNRDDCVSDKVHHVTKITESNYKDYGIQSRNEIKKREWGDKSYKYRVKNSYTGKLEYFNDFNSVTFKWTTGILFWEEQHSQTGELYICDGDAFVLKVSDNKWVEFRSGNAGGVHTYKYAYKHGDSIDLLDDADPNYEKSWSYVKI